MEKKKEFFVKMAPNQGVTLYPACDTCDGKKPGIAYLAGSDEEGNGFVVWITDEKVYEVMKKLVPCGQSA
jgi:hypothetical protein